jgi:alpha-1,2-mannosyltransferase
MSPLALGLSFFTIAAFLSAAWLYRTNAPVIDFTSFWAAGQVVLQGHASSAYDFAAHRALELTVARTNRPVPFLYPPPFLLVVAPFAFRPYWTAYLLWITGTGAIYLIATRRVLQARQALAFPAAFDNVIFGQNAFLTCSAFIIATSLLESQPVLAGGVIGLFVCKPQLALLFPVALLASRNWRAIAGAAASSAALAGIAALVFGLDCYRRFLASGSDYAAMLVRDGWTWNQVASLFGAVRYFGVPQGAALALQAICAFVAIGLTWRAWSKKLEQRVPVLAAGTLLVSPYLFTYDSLLLIIPLGWFLRQRRFARVAVVWLLSLVTLLALFNLLPTPNLTPVAAALSLWWLHSDSLPVDRPKRFSLVADSVRRL